jgi:hypothetical protein
VPGPDELRRYVNVPPPAGPPGSRPGFCPLQVCIKSYLSQKQVVLPRAHGPGPSFIPSCYRAPPRGGGSRSGISPVLGRSSLLFLSPSFVTLCTHRLHSPRATLMHSSPSPFVTLRTHCLHSPRRGPLLTPISAPRLLAYCPYISYPGVYKIYAPYHKRSLIARAFLFFVGQVQSLAHMRSQQFVSRGGNPRRQIAAGCQMC